MKARTVSFKVTIEKPEDVTMQQLAYAIECAICSITGPLPIQDPLCELDKNTIIVNEFKATSPYLNKPLRSEEQANEDIQDRDKG